MGKTSVRDESSETGLRIAETEIDLLAINQNATEYLVGECKFRHSPFSYAEYFDTLAKLSPLKQKAKFHYALFSESGFDERLLQEAEKSNLQLYSLAHIVQCK